MSEKYVTEFRVNGNDANVSKLNAMINGIASQTDDKSLSSYQTMLVVVSTDRPDVHKIISLLAAASNPKPMAKKVYKKQTSSTITNQPPEEA